MPIIPCFLPVFNKSNQTLSAQEFGGQKYVADAQEIARILASDSDYSCLMVGSC